MRLRQQYLPVWFVDSILLFFVESYSTKQLFIFIFSAGKDEEVSY